MAIYQFECNKHGCFDLEYKMGKAPSQAKCKKCGNKANRVFSFSVRITNPTSSARANRGKG